MSNLSDFVIDGILLTKYTGPGGDLVIPEGVKAISDYAGIFPENVEFTSVSLRIVWKEAPGGCGFGRCISKRKLSL